MRIKIIRIIIFLLLLIIALDLLYVQIIRGHYYYDLSVNNRIRVVPLAGLRGLIRDRNGVILAENRLAFDVTIIPQDIRDKDALFDFLEQVLKTEKKRLLQTFWQKKIAPFAPVVVAQDVDKAIAMVMEENRFRFPGLHIQEYYRRYYPFKEIGAHALGYVGKINRSEIEKLQEYGYTPLSVIGKTGIEEYYNSYLMGKTGGLQIEVNSRGQQERLLSLRDPEGGTDIQITIDHRIQKAAAEILGERHGSVIVMALETGEILGFVNSPTYDPNLFASSRSSKKTGALFMDSASPLLNRGVMGLYPAGSVFKIIVATAGLVTQKISPHTTFYCPGYFKLGRRRFRCAHVHDHQDLIQGIAHSCNVYFYSLGEILGPDIMNKYAQLYGLGSKTQVDLPFEATGFIPNRMHRRKKLNRGWYKGETLNLAIGQGDLLVTPIQLLCMVTTVARSGKEVQPHLIKTIGSNKVVRFSTVRNLRIPGDIFNTIQVGMRSAVTDAKGTARLLNKKGFTVSGKTGTAQTSGNKKNHGWFVGFETQGKTKISFVIFLEHGGSSYHACVLARDLLVRMRGEGII